MKKYIITAALSLFSIISLSAQSKKDAQVSKLYQNYIAIKSALASDDADKTSKAATEFIKTASTIDYKQVSEGNLIFLEKMLLQFLKQEISVLKEKLFQSFR
jgi:hypothetical protein